VAARARHVEIDAAVLARFADALPTAELGRAATAFPALGGDAEALAGFVLCLDALNFGSGWFPLLRKEPGLSGYRTIEARLRQRFEREGPIPPRALRVCDARAVAELLGQAPVEPPLDELVELWARALRELGEQVLARASGSFAGFVEEAQGSAAALVRGLLAMPLWRDVARHDGLLVPFLKRAQLAVSDLAHALPEDLGRFHDLSDLTIFADNLVPHVLRLDGVLRFEPEDPRLRGRRGRADRGARAPARGARLRARARRVALAARRRSGLQGPPAPPHALPVLLNSC
jgi:hypothetical protein